LCNTIRVSDYYSYKVIIKGHIVHNCSDTTKQDRCYAKYGFMLSCVLHIYSAYNTHPHHLAGADKNTTHPELGSFFDHNKQRIEFTD